MRLIALLLILTSCFPKEASLDVCLHDVPRNIRELSSPFPSLTHEERIQDWAVEYRIGVGFAKELDLYRAITAFKRSLFLMPTFDRQLELHYNIALSYYLGDRYEEAICAIEESPLAYADPTFPAYSDLLTFLYDAYSKTGNCDKAERVFEALSRIDIEKAEQISLSAGLRQGDLESLEQLSLLDEYCYCAKSISKAQVLSAVIPGSGFLYVGQKQSALTAFVLNALFIVASWQFFQRGYIAAGVFTTSLEIGWYAGGIYGAGEAAYDYNSRLYERIAEPAMQKCRLYPSMLLKWGF